MDDNPFQSPQADSRVVGVLSGEREDLRKVAMYQKGILVCILCYLVDYFGMLALVFGKSTVLSAVLPVFMLALPVIGITGVVFVFLLATKVYGVGLGILLGIFALVPCLGLLVLVAINGKATKILQQNGIRVGLLGASLSNI